MDQTRTDDPSLDARLPDRDDRPLLDRVAEKPRPAVVWTVGALLLVVAELGRLAHGVRSLGGIAVDAVAGGYERTVSAMGGGGPEGVVAATGVALALFLVGLAVATWTRASITDSLADRVSFRARRLFDAVVFGLAVGAALLVVLVSGAVDAVVVGGGVLDSVVGAADSLPTLTARETVPNQGYRTPDGTWHGTFAGLSPAGAWGLRVALIYGYVFAALAWVWVGYLWFREHYRRIDWSPRDDVVRRLRSHRWGQFGMVVTVVFLTMALFAPSLGMATADQAFNDPFSHSIQYYDEASGSVESTVVGTANLQTQSEGFPDSNVGPMSYDQFDRFHPAGTLTNGKDLWTFLVHGARVSLVVGLLSIGVSAVLATVFSLLSAYYRGLVDLVLVVVGDTIMGVPRLLMLILLMVVLKDTWLGGLYNGGILLALILAASGWPFLWRSFRGPTLQIAEEEWVDAATSYGQSAVGIMRLHMLPYLVGYLLIYSSLILGGVILAIAGLSFLGFGITAPTPEWGRAVNMGREYVATDSWHISLIPGVMITLVVMGFNAMGDAMRDAVDPKSDEGSDTTEAAARGGGA